MSTFAFEVRDNSHLYGLFSKDSVEVFFDTDVLRDCGDKGLNEDDMQLKIAPPETKRDKMFLMLQQGQANGRKKGMPPEGIESAYSIDGKVYRLEVRVPWEKIRPRSTKPGTEFGDASPLGMVAERRAKWSADHASQIPGRRGLCGSLEASYQNRPTICAQTVRPSCLRTSCTMSAVAVSS